MIHAALATLTQFEFIILNADELLATLNVMWQTCKGTGCLCCGVFPILYALWRIFEQATINANSDHMMVVLTSRKAGQHVLLVQGGRGGRGGRGLLAF